VLIQRHNIFGTTASFKIPTSGKVTIIYRAQKNHPVQT